MRNFERPESVAPVVAGGKVGAAIHLARDLAGPALCGRKAPKDGPAYAYAELEHRSAGKWCKKCLALGPGKL